MDHVPSEPYFVDLRLSCDDGRYGVVRREWPHPCVGPACDEPHHGINDPSFASATEAVNWCREHLGTTMWHAEKAVMSDWTAEKLTAPKSGITCCRCGRTGGDEYNVSAEEDMQAYGLDTTTLASHVDADGERVWVLCYRCQPAPQQESP